MNDFPRSKVVDGKWEVIQDNADIYQYYAKGIPKYWVFGSQKLTYDQMKAWADKSHLSLREALDKAKEQKKFIGVIH